MNPSYERTLKILRTLDEELYKFSLGNHEGTRRITGTIRWINLNLERKAVFEMLDVYPLSFKDAIKALLEDEVFNPRTNA